MQCIECFLDDAKLCGSGNDSLFGAGLDEAFKTMAEFADAEQPGHARTAFEGVQIALQTKQRFDAVLGLLQLHQQVVALVEQILGFFGEDIQQFFIEISGVQPIRRFIL